jgi:dGTPase
MINRVVTDLIENSRAAIEHANPGSIDDVRALKTPLIAFTDTIFDEHRDLKRFLNENMYRHPTVKKMTDKAQDMVAALFGKYMGDPAEMPDEFSARAASGDESVKARVVADYIAGMTDRFAIAEYERLC